MIGDRELRRIDVPAIGGPRQQPGELGRCLAPGALERAIDDVAAAFLASDVVFELPGVCAAPANMPPHGCAFVFSITRIAADSTSFCRTSSLVTIHLGARRPGSSQATPWAVGIRV